MREAALRFSPEEAASLIRDGLGLDVADHLVAELIRQTEGWAAGLQLDDVLLALRSGAGPRDPGDAPAALLSRKELQALRLLVSGRTNEEIARSMFVSSNTVKTHLRRIYGELGVRSRAEAIARATALRLVKP